MNVWIQVDPRFHPDNLGFLPDIIYSEDPRPVKEQLEDRYRHGGGYRPMKGFTMKNYVLHYPGDPPFKPAAMTTINKEVVVFYTVGSLLAIIQPNGTFEVTRVD